MTGLLGNLDCFQLCLFHSKNIYFPILMFNIVHVIASFVTPQLRVEHSLNGFSISNYFSRSHQPMRMQRTVHAWPLCFMERTTRWAMPSDIWLWKSKWFLDLGRCWFSVLLGKRKNVVCPCPTKLFFFFSTRKSPENCEKSLGKNWNRKELFTNILVQRERSFVGVIKQWQHGRVNFYE